jgi:serine/threonine-protein kinase
MWLAAALAAAIAVTVLAWPEDEPERLTVPRVTGLDAAEAKRRVQAAGFAAIVDLQANPAPRGSVYSQDPVPGSRLRREQAVLVFVSSGAQVTVPPVTGFARAEAAARLRRAKLTPRFVAVAALQPRGTVVATEPAPGQVVEPGAAVQVTVSSGSGRVVVPSLLGTRSAGAQARVVAAGLTRAAFDVPAAEPAGTVVGQSPQPGTEVTPGSRVRLDVSTGVPSAGSPAPAPVTVPDAVGRTLADAQDLLESAGLVVRVEYVDSGQPQAVVLSHEPRAGARVRRGTNVRLAIATGPEPFESREVIELVGLVEDGATSATETAGFYPLVRRERTPDPNEVGIVLRQEPQAHGHAPTQAPVTIYVGEPW